MKKFVASLLCALLLATIFTGCSGETQDPLVLNKSEYLQGEEVYVTARKVGDDNTWVGIFTDIDYITETTESIRWYYVAREGFVEGQTYGVQHSLHEAAGRRALVNLPAGGYKAVLFGDNGKSDVRAVEYFKVLPEALGKPSAPINVEYKLSSLLDGLADGTVTVTFDEGGVPASEIVMYWANEDGILADYTSLAPQKVHSAVQSFQMTPRSMIPAEATKLRVYSKNNTSLSADYFEVALPAGAGYTDFGEQLSEFQVVSDIHISNLPSDPYDPKFPASHDEHFRLMCLDIARTSPNSSGVFVVGDIADTGDLTEWERMDFIRQSVDGLPEFYFALGNHDLGIANRLYVPYDEVISYYFRYAKTDSVYFEREIDGFHHLFLGSEDKIHEGDPVDDTTGDAHLSEAQLDWLDSKLSAITRAEPDKPVFVYLHQSLADTVAGSLGGKSGQGWNGITEDEQLRDIIARYSQVVMFNGHSHWDMNSERNMYVKDNSLPNIFNTGAVGYLWSSFYVPQGVFEEGSEGYYVRLYKDKIIVLGRDFISGKWIPSACYEARI